MPAWLINKVSFVMLLRIAICEDYMSSVTGKPVFDLTSGPDTNQAVQPNKMARGLKFQISKLTLYEPLREKTGFLHMRKQRCRSASR